MVFPGILPDKQGFDFSPLTAFGSPYAVPDHLKRHLAKGVFFYILKAFYPKLRHNLSKNRLSKKLSSRYKQLDFYNYFIL